MADRLRESEVGVPVAGVDIVVEDAADAAHLVPVLEREVVVAPGLELVVGRDRGMRVAGGFHRGMEGLRVGIALRAATVEHRGEVGAAAEPCFCRNDKARVHVHRRHMRIVQVRDQRDARGPEARVVGGARESPCGIPARIRRARSSNAPRPSRTRGRASWPSPRRHRAHRCGRCGSRACARNGRPGDRRRALPPAARPRAPRTPRRSRRAGFRTMRARGPCGLRSSSHPCELSRPGWSAGKGRSHCWSHWLACFR